MLPRPAKSVQNGAGFSGKTRIYWACSKGKSGLSATQRAVGKYARAALAKRKRNRALSPEYQIIRGRESRRARAAPWQERGGPEREHEEKKDGIHSEGSQVPKRRLRASKKSLPKGSRRLLLFTRPLPRDGNMAEDHGAPEAGKLPRVWTRGRKETESRQRVSGAQSP